MRTAWTTCGIGIVMVFALLSLAPHCQAEPPKNSQQTSIAEVERQTKELLHVLKAYGADQREEAIRKARPVLENLDRQIDALEARIDEQWDRMDSAARAKARASLKALRQQRTEVAEWYGGLQNGSVEAWGRMKAGFSTACRALKDAWEKAEKEFGPENGK